MTAFWRTARPLASRPDRDVGSVYEISTPGIRWLSSAIALLRAVEVIPSVVQVSKYGAKTCAGCGGGGVAAVAPPAHTTVASVIAVAASAVARNLRFPSDHSPRDMAAQDSEPDSVR